MKNTARHTLAASLIACLGLMGTSSAFAQAFDAARIYGAVPERDGGVIGLGVGRRPEIHGLARNPRHGLAGD